MNFDFETPYQRYPNREGKKAGMEKLKKTIKTKAEYDAFVSAMDNYILLCEKKGRIRGGYVMMWKTFVNNWTDYLDPTLITDQTKSTNLAQLERIQKGEL